MATSPNSGVLTCPRCGRPKTPAEGVCADCNAEMTRIASGDAPTTFSGDAPTVFTGETPTTFSDQTPTTFAEGAPTMLHDDGRTTLAPPTIVPTPPTGRSKEDTGPLTIGDAFGRYTIVRMLGIGGMGAVYQAWDSELDVVVALKVIRPEVLKDPAAGQEIERRFKRELLLARQVTHKNVVRIHDLGEIRGIKYITMSYVNGTDLSSLVKKEGRLPVETTLRIMRAVVSGLVAAHTAGVVHRDLKPANIMVDKDGEVLIMDFGIARSTGAPNTTGPAPDAKHGVLESLQAASKYAQATTYGAVVGTVEYMAPEQALGQAVDQRADIYTTGLILYDLLSGVKRSDLPGTAIERLRARMERPLPAIKSLAPDVPDALAAIVTKAVEIDAAHRYQTTAELAEELGRLDDKGVPLPVKRSVSLPMMSGIVAAVVALAVGGSWLLGLFEPKNVKPPDPVSVVIADFDNRSGDKTFDRTLEPMLRRALEGAGFITALDRNGLKITGADLPEKMDEAAAVKLASKQGLGRVLSGAIDKQGNNYRVSMKVQEALTGKVLSDVKSRAISQDKVLDAATNLVGDVREALGDRTTKTDPIFAQMSLSASSLEVVRYYAAAQDANSNNKYEDAKANLLKAVELDPKFGVGYLALSGVSRNLRKPDDALMYVQKAFDNLDGMTDRERLTTRGMYFRLTGDYKQCVAEHLDLINKYAADIIGHNQLALCASQLRDIKRAREEMEAIVKLLPERVIFRDNLSLYSSYISDFIRGEQEAQIVFQKAPRDAYGRVALAFALMGLGQAEKAIATYRDLARIQKDKDGKDELVYGSSGPTMSTAGLGSIALYEGRFAEAVRVLEQGAEADLAAKLNAPAAAKFAEVAYAQLSRGQKAAAVAAAERALAAHEAVKIRFLAARTYVEAGQAAKAKPLAAALAAEAQPEPQAYAKIIAAQIAVASQDFPAAIKLLTEANDLYPDVGTWVGHFELGRAFLAAGQFAQADGQFDKCFKRRGEANTLFLDEEPTFGYFPMVFYYQGRAREGLKLPGGGAESYRKYLEIREKAGEDPLIADIKKRLANR